MSNVDRKQQQAIDRLSRTAATIRQGVITDDSPLTVSISGGTAVTGIKAVDGWSPSVNDRVSVLVGGNQAIILPPLTDSPSALSGITVNNDDWSGTDLAVINGGTGASTASGARDNLELYDYCCRVYNSANISCATSGSPTTLTFNSERYDPAGMHSTSSNTSRITFPVDGIYNVSGHIQFASNGTGRRQILIQLNGGSYIARHGQPAVADSGAGTEMSIATDYEFAAGDYVELQALQASGGALNVTAAGNYSPEFSAHFIRPT